MKNCSLKNPPLKNEIPRAFARGTRLAFARGTRLAFARGTRLAFASYFLLRMGVRGWFSTSLAEIVSEADERIVGI